MTKLAFVLAFSFFALQGLNATSLKVVQSDVSRADGNEVKDLIKEVNKVLASATARKSKVIRQLDEKFNEIKTTVDLPGRLAELKLNINQTLSENNSTAEFCGEEAWESVAALEETVTSVESCRSRINDDGDMANFKKQIQTIVSQVWDLLRNITSGMYDCIRFSYGSYQEFIECVETNVVKAKNNLKIYDKAMQDIFDVVETFLPLYTNTMTSCIDSKKLEFIKKEQELIEDLQDCVKINS